MVKKTKVKKPNPVSGGVDIKLGGKQRILRLDFNALVALEDVIGKSTMDPAFFVGFPSTAKDMRAFLWAMLQHETPDMTLEQAGALLSTADMAELSEAFGDVQGASLPAADGLGGGAKGDGANPPTASAG